MKKNIISIRRNSLQFCKCHSSFLGYSHQTPIDYEKKLVINPKKHLYYWDDCCKLYRINKKQIICIYDSKTKKNIKFKFSHTVNYIQYQYTLFVYIHNSGLPIYSCEPSGIGRTLEDMKLHIKLIDEFNPRFSESDKQFRRRKSWEMERKYMNDTYGRRV